SPNPIVVWWKRIEARSKTWLLKCVSAEENSGATALGAPVKLSGKRLLLAYLLVVGAATIALETFSAKIGWARSFLVANFLYLTFVAAGATAWYGYRKYTGPQGRKNYAILVVTIFVGGVVGALWDAIENGRPITDIDAHKLGMTFGAVTAMGAAIVAVIAGIAYARSRQVAQRMVLLQGEADRERLTRQGVQAELKLLQAQIEPHFLFNTLANLRFLVQTQSPHAIPMLDHLIHYLRTALPEIRAESSTVGREIELARAYLEILRIRMGGALEISTEVQHGLAGVAFPPLMVLTLVENAIKHGISPVGRGRVGVRATAEGERLRVCIEDDGRGLTEPIGQGVGLGNVRERLRALYGDSARLDLSGREGGGTLATIEVPL
ncbi:MAG TPA: histidine kinase, partial [Usitatibacter sp.]